MTIRKSTPAAPPAAERSPIELYVEQLSRTMGAYAKPAREARRIVDDETGNLTEMLYEMRRNGRDLK